MSALFDIEVMRQDSSFGGTWSWWSDPRSVAHLINSGPHNIDLCRWWLDAEVATVVAHSGTFREENPNENTTMALLSFDDGTMATFWSSSVVPSPGFPGESFRFRIMGDEGIIDHDPYGKLQLGRDSKWETKHEQPPVGHDDANAAFSLNRMQAYCDQMQAFVNTINGQTGGEGTDTDGRAGVAAVLGMLESSSERWRARHRFFGVSGFRVARRFTVRLTPDARLFVTGECHFSTMPLVGGAHPTLTASRR